MNLYQVLGLHKTASKHEIKKAYKILAQNHHPDKGGDQEQFQRIQDAYEVLSDPDKRAHYDRTGEAPRPEPENQAALMLFDIAFRVMDKAQFAKKNYRADILNAIYEKQAEAKACYHRFEKIADGIEYFLDNIEAADEVIVECFNQRRNEANERLKAIDNEINLLDEAEELAKAFKFTGPGQLTDQNRYRTASFGQDPFAYYNT